MEYLNTIECGKGRAGVATQSLSMATRTRSLLSLSGADSGAACPACEGAVGVGRGLSALSWAGRGQRNIDTFSLARSLL